MVHEPAGPFRSPEGWRPLPRRDRGGRPRSGGRAVRPRRDHPAPTTFGRSSRRRRASSRSSTRSRTRSASPTSSRTGRSCSGSAGSRSGGRRSSGPPGRRAFTSGLAVIEPRLSLDAARAPAARPGGRRARQLAAHPPFEALRARNGGAANVPGDQGGAGAAVRHRAHRAAADLRARTRGPLGGRPDPRVVGRRDRERPVAEDRPRPPPSGARSPARRASPTSTSSCAIETDDGVAGWGEMSDLSHLPLYQFDLAQLQSALSEILVGARSPGAEPDRAPDDGLLPRRGPHVQPVGPGPPGRRAGHLRLPRSSGRRAGQPPAGRRAARSHRRLLPGVPPAHGRPGAGRARPRRGEAAARGSTSSGSTRAPITPPTWRS